MSPPSDPSRILIVEDAPANIQALTAILRDQGYAISVATNGQRALQAMQTLRPDLILLDVMMPEMDGYETCERLKAHPEWRDIPVIFLTARADTGVVAREVDRAEPPHGASGALVDLGGLGVVGPGGPVGGRVRGVASRAGAIGRAAATDGIGGVAVGLPGEDDDEVVCLGAQARNAQAAGLETIAGRWGRTCGYRADEAEGHRLAAGTD